MKIAFALAAVFAVATAQAQESPQWILRAGVHPVQPQSQGRQPFMVGDGTAITFAATRMLSRHWGIEALASLPVEHEIALRGAGTVARVRQLPPTLSLQYHFPDPNGRIRGYVGAGLNRTIFFDERTQGALQGGDLELSDSWGPTVQAGLDFRLGRGWFVNIDARWFDVDTEVRLDGARFGAVEIDPYAVGMTLARQLP